VGAAAKLRSSFVGSLRRLRKLTKARVTHERWETNGAYRKVEIDIEGDRVLVTEIAEALRDFIAARYGDVE